MHEALRFLGLLNRGGQLYFGPTLEMRLGKVALLFVANDARNSDKMVKKATGLHIPIVSRFGKAELGQALGYDELSYVGIVNRKAAKAMQAKLKGVEDEKE